VVGRELPKQRPNGEDHQGAGRIYGERRKRGILLIMQEIELWRSWTATIPTRKGSVSWFQVAVDIFGRMHFKLQVRVWAEVGVAAGRAKAMHIRMTRRANQSRTVTTSPRMECRLLREHRMKHSRSTL